jgi:uncharacterized membrane protein (UPF0127 family)
LQVRTPAGGTLALSVAASFAARLAGLALRAPPPPAGGGLLIPRCASVHTFGMRYALDVAFVRWPAPGGRLQVIAVREHIVPWRAARVAAPRRGTAAIELRAGAAARHGIAPGAALEAIPGSARAGLG